jgi:3'-phosphoadenosine 5'-phosphosulfate sulfotransferase (PAPS reductase)/FAD synthetase
VKVPLKRAITERLYGAEHFVALEGSRWYENDFRRSHPRINFVKGYERQVWVHPIAAWTGLDVWTYIHREGLRVNPMYAKGYQRTTCWHCPIVNPLHMELSKRQYPELWQDMEGVKLVGFDDGDNLRTPF